MARRLPKTTADYLAIAISPALIMTLVGSLVFFLVELFYVGEFHARLNYVFALFVFAAVLIARIAIEMGKERAMLFGLALGIAVFLVLAKFVQHPGPFSHLINGCLIGIVWWCAHRLTWDCTLIDEREDASGEGLMQRIGVDSTGARGPIDDGPDNDGPEDNEPEDGGRDARGAHADRLEPGRGPVPDTAENELLATDDGQGLHAWWKRWLGRRGPHPPGMWVLYFSLAALPIFGLGQRLIPTGDTGRRRYVFVLLTVYVASALALLVTTSFLGLRRYLRQRRIEMPAPIAATWVIGGGLLIVVVLLIAVLLPRPHAEYAVSQIPWQVRSPEGLTPSQRSMGPDGVQNIETEENAEDQAEQPQQTDPKVTDAQPNEDQSTRNGSQKPKQSGQNAAGENGSQKSPQGPRSQDQDSKDQGSKDQDAKSRDAKDQGHNQPASAENAKQQSAQDQSTESSRSPHESDDAPQAQGDSLSQEGQADARPPQEVRSQEPQTHEPQTHASESRSAQTADRRAPDRQSPPDTKPIDAKPYDQQQTAENRSSGTPSPPAAGRPTPPVPHPSFSLPIAGIGAILKLLFYAVIALIIGYLGWKNRRRLLAALADLMGQLRDLLARLLGRKPSAINDATDEPSAPRKVAPPTFAQFQDPFLSGRSLAPEHLVRYTFEAFEAWARDQGIARRADQTPHELVRLAVPPQTDLSSEARRMVRLYNSLAYAGVKVPREQAARLQTLWALMRKTGEERIRGLEP